MQYSMIQQYLWCVGAVWFISSGLCSWTLYGEWDYPKPPRTSQNPVQKSLCSPSTSVSLYIICSRVTMSKCLTCACRACALIDYLLLLLLFFLLYLLLPLIVYLYLLFCIWNSILISQCPQLCVYGYVYYILHVTVSLNLFTQAFLCPVSPV